MTITKNNFKSPQILFGWGVLGIFAIALCAVAVISNSIESLYIAVPIFLLLGTLYVVGFMTKITIDNDGVTQKSPFSSKTIKWNDIKTVGVIRVSQYSLTVLDPADYEKGSLSGQKWIFVSTQPNYHPFRGQKQTRSEEHTSE